MSQKWHIGLLAYTQAVAGKKQTDATQNLRPEDPIQELPKGTKIGLPTRRQVFDALERCAPTDKELVGGEWREVLAPTKPAGGTIPASPPKALRR